MKAIDFVFEGKDVYFHVEKSSRISKIIAQEKRNAAVDD